MNRLDSTRDVAAALLMLALLAGVAACERPSRPEEGKPGLHDHTPHHGGVVGMAGMMHLEARAERGGLIEVYLTDRWRRPLPLADVNGTVTLRVAGAKRVLPLRADSDALRAKGPPLEGRDVNAYVEIARGGEPIDMHFQLPLRGRANGAAGVPAEGCVAPPPAADGRERPRCTVTFARPLAALAAAPDGSLAIAAVVELGASAWRLPAGEFLLGLAAPPPIAVPADEPPHVEAANAVALRPGGGEAVVAIENRLIRYSLESGGVVRAYAGPGGILRAVAWSPDGSRLVVTAFYDRFAHLLDAADGTVAHRLGVEREGAGVAFSPDGALVAVGSEAGSVTVFDAASGAPLRSVSTSHRPVGAVTITGDRLLTAGDDGVLRIWRLRDGALEHAGPPGAPIHFIAAAPSGDRVATGGTEGLIRIHDSLSGEVVRTLRAGTAQIRGLAWTRGTLVSADTDGNLGLWSVDDERGGD